MDRWFTELDKLANMYPEYDFILPIHPNPNVQKWKYLLKMLWLLTHFHMKKCLIY
jgi:UDP-N-acetylglucosamine 2-epimerase